MVIKNCLLTNSDAKIIKYYHDTDNIGQYYREELHSGIDIECKDVYSISPGVVILVGDNNVIIQADDNYGYNYCHLKSKSVSYYQTVEVGEKIGEADGFVHFEAFGPQQGRWPVRVGLKTWYKFDPIHILENGYISTYSSFSHDMISYHDVYLGDLTSDIEMSQGKDNGV